MGNDTTESVERRYSMAEMGLAERYGIKHAAKPDPFPIDVTSFGNTHHVEIAALGIKVEFEGSYTAAWEHGRMLVRQHLREHGPVKIERPVEQADDDGEDVFGGY